MASLRQLVTEVRSEQRTSWFTAQLLHQSNYSRGFICIPNRKKKPTSLPEISIMFLIVSPLSSHGGWSDL